MDILDLSVWEREAFLDFLEGEVLLDSVGSSLQIRLLMAFYCDFINKYIACNNKIHQHLRPSSLT